MPDKTISYPNTPYLSKIKLPTGNEYYLKDKDARDILNAINADVYTILQQAMGTVAAGGNHLVNAENIKAYVDEIAEIGFDVVVLTTLPTADETAYETYHNNIVLIADATSTTGAYVEYVILRKNTGTEEAPVYTYNWERIGTTQVDLSGYLKNVSYDVATHTLKQTKNDGQNGDVTTDVHTFGDMADADIATGTYTIPTGSGTVTVNQYDITGNESSAITGEGTTDIEYVNGVTGSTTSAIQFNYNSIKDSNLVYGETTGKSVSIVSGLTGTTSFNTNAIDDANLVDGGVAGKSVSVVNGLTGTTSYPTVAYYTEVESECLTFKTVTNATFGVTEKTIGLTTNAATTSSFDVIKAPLGLTTTLADSTGFEVTTKHIHVTHTTPTATVTVDKTTDTVTVNPVPQTQE